MPQGNPPSGVAAGYVWFDIVALALAPAAHSLGSENPIGLAGSARLSVSWRIAPIGTISSCGSPSSGVRDERQEAVARLGRERREPQQGAVGELDLDHRLLEPVLGRERLDPAVDPGDEILERPAIPGVQSSGTAGL